ncbi:hypothetical protein TELCIR_24311, partial [Teladorsagia circumcincta]
MLRNCDTGIVSRYDDVADLKSAQPFFSNKFFF